MGPGDAGILEPHVAAQSATHDVGAGAETDVGSRPRTGHDVQLEQGRGPERGAPGRRGTSHGQVDAVHEPPGAESLRVADEPTGHLELCVPVDDEPGEPRSEGREPGSCGGLDDELERGQGGPGVGQRDPEPHRAPPAPSQGRRRRVVAAPPHLWTPG